MAAAASIPSEIFDISPPQEDQLAEGVIPAFARRITARECCADYIAVRRCATFRPNLSFTNVDPDSGSGNRDSLVQGL
jgi:hypothetical protein